MDPSVRYRPMSPAGKHMIDPMRASTGTMPLSSYDPYDSTVRYGYNYPPYPVDAPAPYAAPYDPRVSSEARLEAQPVSSKTYRDPGHSTKLRTEYAIRPRQRSNTASAADIHHSPIHHSPLRVAIPSYPSSRQPPVITSASAYTRSSSPQPSGESYVVPASSLHGRHHRRIYSTDYASDTGRLDPNDRKMRGHEYRGHAPHSHWRYPHSVRKGEDIDDYDAYSYTNPREQFEKDSAARSNYGRSLYRPERPLSMTEIDDIPQWAPKKESRALGPPPSSRGFDKIDRDAVVRRPVYDSGDSDYGRDPARSRRRSRQRVPVALHQTPDDDHSSYREDDGHRHRRRRHRKDDETGSRQSADDRVSRKANTGEPLRSSAGLGTAGLGYSDDFDYELSPRTDRHGPERPRRPSRRRMGSDSDAYTSDEDLKNYRREPVAPKEGSDSGSGDHLAVTSRHRRHHRDETSSKASSAQGSGSSQEDLKTAIAEPSRKELDPPKGILKKPRAKFPEEPNPVREGVAPLKDAHKKGIPPGARWTKVDRRLVNPAALEAGNERFEERSEYVIVLRVLSKEEIQAYAVKTQEIRDSRRQEYLRDRRRRREEERRKGRKVDDFSSDDEDEGEPLAIEAA